MDEQTECWQLRSGTWYRDLESETWRLAATAHGTVVNARLSSQDVGRMVGAMRETSSGEWFPSDFNYSPQTGAPLHVTITCLDSPWVPPFGAGALSDISKPLARGLRQTPAPLVLARTGGSQETAMHVDRTLPALPRGHHHFLVHKLDVASPTLLAIEPQQGELLVLLPESKTWTALERAGGGMLAPGPKNSRGWRMEVVEGVRGASLYFPTANGLAAVTPAVTALSYTLEYFGEAVALGGPVAWAGAIWLPVLGEGGLVTLVGKTPGAARSAVLPTSVTAAKNGFEAPVFDPLQVIWPSEEGQLVLRREPNGKRTVDWIAWPDGLRPMFAVGCPYLSRSGSFWQPCWTGEQERFEYVQMGAAQPERFAMDAPRPGTGRTSYKNAQRIDGEPWKEPEQAADGASPHVVVPILESQLERAVIGLRIEAPHGLAALLESGKDRHRAVLQLQAENRADVLFGILHVRRPWLASLFVYDAHLWVYHPELPQPLGWKLES